MEIVNVIFSILSFFATILVSVAIFWLQRRHEKELDKTNEQRRKENIQECAKVFIIDNQDEIGLLPLCVIAASANKYKNHHRQIYTRFNKCSKEIQQEILNQENIPIHIMDNNSWINDYLEQFEKDAEKYKLGKLFLDDCREYLDCAVEDFQDKTLDDTNPYIFDLPPFEKASKLFSDIKHDLTHYIDRYIEYVLKDREDTCDKPELLPHEPPFDMLNRTFDFGTCDLKILNFWVMRSILSGCVALCRHDLINDCKAEWRRLSVNEDLITTYEDLYYETLLMLFTTYGNR